VGEGTNDAGAGEPDAGSNESDAGSNESDAGNEAPSPEPDLTLSNLPPDLLPPSPEGDLRIAGECNIDTESGAFDCSDTEGALSFQVVEPEGASRIGVIRVNSLQIDMGGILRVSGALPLVLVANDTLRVFGRISVSALHHEQFAGGFAPANGPGAGQLGAFWPSSGGSYCGVGGDASAPEGESPVLPGGSVYGSEALSPLLGGSGGGGDGGAGGGALQLVAGVEIQVGITGVVDAGGGGGRNGGGGGGSGGSLLLEAPSVSIEGVLAANGGGGGRSTGGSGGSNANPNATAALGEGANNGGEGSAADEANGAAGVYLNNNDVPGGGGGAGRIRINTLDGTAQISGTISPSEISGCMTLGTLP
jgi:hypothetical protein